MGNIRRYTRIRSNIFLFFFLVFFRPVVHVVYDWFLRKLPVFMACLLSRVEKTKQKTQSTYFSRAFGNMAPGYQFCVIGDLTTQWYGNRLPIFIPCPIPVRLITSVAFGSVSVRTHDIIPLSNFLTKLPVNRTQPVSKPEDKNTTDFTVYVYIMYEFILKCCGIRIENRSKYFNSIYISIYIKLLVFFKQIFTTNTITFSRSLK